MRIIWDSPLERVYSQGVSNGVFYPKNSPGVAWNGLISISESEEQTQESRYFDGQKYHGRNRLGGVSGTISSYTYPEELESYLGLSEFFTAQPRKSFGISYRTNNEIHILYNVLAAPSKNDYSSADENLNPIAFEWPFTTLPIEVPGAKPSSHLVIDPGSSDPLAISYLEAAIYGDDENDPYLPSPAEVISFFEATAILQIDDHGDGSWTATGPDNIVIIVDPDTFRLDWISVVITGDMTYKVSSY